MNKRLRHIASVISPYDLGEKTFLSALTLLKRKKRSAPIPAFFTLIQRLAPGLKVVSQVRAGRTIYLPAYLKDKSATYHALRWSLAKEGFMPKTLMAMRLITNLLEASAKTGVAYKSKRELNISVVQSRVNYRRKRRKWTPLEIRKHQKQKRIPYLIRKRKAISLKNRPAIRQLTYLTDVLPPALMTKRGLKHKRKFKKRRPLKEKHIKLTQEKQKMHSRNMTKLSKLQNNILLVILYIIILFSTTTSFDHWCDLFKQYADKTTTSFDHWCDISKQYAGKTFTIQSAGAKNPISVTCFDNTLITIPKVISSRSSICQDTYYNTTNTSRAIFKHTTVRDEKYTFIVYHNTIKINFKTDYITENNNQISQEFRAHLYFPQGVDLIKRNLIQQGFALAEKMKQIFDGDGCEIKRLHLIRRYKRQAKQILDSLQDLVFLNKFISQKRQDFLVSYTKDTINLSRSVNDSQQQKSILRIKKALEKSLKNPNYKKHLNNLFVSGLDNAVTLSLYAKVQKERKKKK